MAYITYVELAEEQRKPLDYKIEKAIEAVAQGFAVCKHQAALDSAEKKLKGGAE
jgi:hypothetical protein